MTLDHAVALSLLENLPRVNLTERLKNDPDLLARAVSTARAGSRCARTRRASRRFRSSRGMTRDFPTALATLTDLPPVLWYRGQLVCHRAARDCHRGIARRLGGRDRNGVEAGG